MKSSNNFKKNTFLLTLGTFINKGLQFIAIPFFSKWLSTEDYGRFDLLVTYTALLIPIISLSCHEGIFRMSVNESDEAKLKGYITSGFIIDVINYIVFVIILFALYGNRHFTMFIGFSLYLMGEVLLIYLRGVLRGLKKLDIYSFVLMFSTVIMIVTVTLLVRLLNYGLEGIIFGYAVGSVIGSIIVAISVRWWRYISVSKINISLIKDMLTYSVPLIPNDLSWWVMNASDRQIINYYYGNAANGIYAIAHKIPAICSILFSTISLSWQQETSVSIEEGIKINLNGYLDSMIKMLSSFCAVLIAGSFILYFYIFDKKYYDAYLYSPILILSSAFLAISLFLGGILAGYKRTKSNGISTIIGAITNLITHFGLIPFIGLFAASVSTLISNIVTCIIRVFSLRDVYRIKFNKYVLVHPLVLIYFFVISYFNENLFFNCINLCIAMVYCYIVNRKFLESNLIKIMRRRK